EIAEHEFVALLGDLRRGGDVDDVGNAFLLRDLRDSRALAGVESAHENLRAITDQLLGSGPGNFHFGFRVPVHDRQRGQTELLENGGRDVRATLTVLADTGLHARPW